MNETKNTITVNTLRNLNTDQKFWLATEKANEQGFKISEVDEVLFNGVSMEFSQIIENGEFRFNGLQLKW